MRTGRAWARRSALGVAWAAALGVLALGGVARAEDPKLVVVLEGPGRDGSANAQLVLEALAADNGRWEVQDQAWFQARVDARGFRLPDVLDAPEELSQASERRPGEPEVDVVVRLLAGRKRGTLELILYDGASGAIVGSYEPKMKRNRIADAPEAVAAIDEMTVFVGWPDAPPPKLEPVVAPLDAELLEPVEPVEAPSLQEGPLFSMEAGFAGLKRDFSVVTANGGVDYSTGFYPGLRLDAEVYPYPWGGAIVGNLGLTARFVRGSDTVQLGLADGSVQELASTHTELGLGVVYRQEFSPTLRLRYGLGWQSVDFVLEANPVYGSTTYGALWLGGQIVLGLVDALSFVGTVEILPLVGLGDSATEFGASASSFGFTGELALSYELFEGLSARLAYRLRAMNASYEGEGTRELEGKRLADATSNDYVQEPTLRVGYSW